METAYKGSGTEITLLQSRITEMARHMQFIGMYFIIFGALVCLTIIGALFGIPYLIAGLRLRESAQSYKAYAAMSDARQLITAFEKQSSFFFILKVLFIVSLVLVGLYVLGMFILFAYMGSDMFFDTLMDY